MLFKRIYLTTFIAIFVSLLAGCGPISAAFHDPRALPELARESRVHYEPGAEAYAREVARILPGAMAKVEAAHGRHFGKPFVVVAFLSNEAYAAANGRGDANPRGVTFFDRVTLSPSRGRRIANCSRVI